MTLVGFGSMVKCLADGAVEAPEGTIASSQH